MKVMQRPFMSWLGWGLLVSFFAIAQFRILLIVLGPRLESIIKAAYGVTEGMPHWRIFQSRILGPYLADFISSLFSVGYQFGFMIAVFLLFLVFYASLIFVLKQLFQDTGKVIFASMMVFIINTILIQGYWLYLWDLVDLIVITWLIWAIIKHKSVWVILVILAVEIINREIVLLLAAWLLFDALVKVDFSKQFSSAITLSINKVQAIASLIFLIIAFFVIEFIRDKLLIREIGPEIFSDVKASGKYLNFQLLNNLQALTKSFITPLHNYNIVFNFIIFAIPAIAGIQLYSVANDEEKRLAVLFAVLWLSTMCFGLIYETRVWLLFAPYLAMAMTGMVFKFNTRSGLT